jgi:hypothetical protein
MFRIAQTSVSIRCYVFAIGRQRAKRKVESVCRNGVANVNRSRDRRIADRFLIPGDGVFFTEGQPGRPKQRTQREIVAQGLCQKVPQKGPQADAWGLADHSRRDYNFLFMPVVARLEEFDPLAPQREAALFYGLFLRGHSAETLRRDIDVPVKLLNKLMFRHRNEQAMRQKVQRTYLYRKQVLSIFDELVTREQALDRASVRVH